MPPVPAVLLVGGTGSVLVVAAKAEVAITVVLILLLQVVPEFAAGTVLSQSTINSTIRHDFAVICATNFQ